MQTLKVLKFIRTSWKLGTSPTKSLHKLLSRLKVINVHCLKLENN